MLELDCYFKKIIKWLKMAENAGRWLIILNIFIICQQFLALSVIFSSFSHFQLCQLCQLKMAETTENG
jgi:hypothetical protein